MGSVGLPAESGQFGSQGATERVRVERAGIQVHRAAEAAGVRERGDTEAHIAVDLGEGLRAVERGAGDEQPFLRASYVRDEQGDEALPPGQQGEQSGGQAGPGQLESALSSSLGLG